MVKEEKEIVTKQERVENKENNSKEVFSLIMGLIACVFSFLGILLLPVSIIGLVKAVKSPGNSGTKVAAIIFNALSIFLEIVVTVVIVIIIGVFKFTFTTFDKTINKTREIIDNYDYDDHYKEKDMSTVVMGNDKFGYLEILNRWNFGIIEEESFVKLYSKYNHDDEIVLEIINDCETLEDAYSKTFFKLAKAGNSVKTTETIINRKYAGYHIESWGGIDNSKYFNIYVFKTEDNVFRSITISSYDATNEIFDAYDTFYLNRAIAG